MVTKKLTQPFKVGDRVRIRHTDNLRGRIVEFRGPLGPRGMLVYRVRIPRKPKATYIELCADQLAAMPPGTKGYLSGKVLSSTRVRSPKSKSSNGRNGQ